MSINNITPYGCNNTRKEIPNNYKWDLSALFESQLAWQDACKVFKKKVSAFSAFKGTIKSPNSLFICLEAQTELAQQAEKIYAYARLQRDTDNADNLFQELVGQAESLIADYNNITSFLEPELLTLTPFSISDYLAIEPGLAPYSHYLENLQRKAKHILSTREEEILAQSQLATASAENIFRIFTGADLKFSSVQDSQGLEHGVSEGNYLLNMTSTDRELRKNTFYSLFGAYSNFENTLATSLSGNCRAANFYASIHNYPDTLTAALAEDNIPTTLYDNLINVVNQNLKPLHDYIDLKKQTLQLNSLHFYDLYVPLTQLSDEFSFTYEEACNLIKDALKPLGPEYCQALNQAFTDGWIDIYENKGKRSGAYSWGIFGAHPYILLNFQSRYNSVSTLAHELGHAMHSMLSSNAQHYINADYTIFCAEVASTTNEILLFEHTYQNATPNQKKFLLNQCLETIRATVYRQVQFAEFERYIHNEIAAGKTLVPSNLELTWLALNEKYYGKSLTLDKKLGVEWSRIPHFYTPFYVYKYATGYAAANTFAEKILTKDPDSQKRYIEFLSSGGSNYSLDLLTKAGVNLETSAPITKTLNRFAHLLEELKKLL
ncbi:MAG TPA: oligoendopeptidase F [Candidatus Dorea intestinavium]|nr:oligoendopeptidase F [Candidatus Dorea intestinavium]